MQDLHASLLERIFTALDPCPPATASSLLLTCKHWQMVASVLPQLLPSLSLTPHKLRLAQQEGRQAELAALLKRKAVVAQQCELHMDAYREGGWTLLGELLEALAAGGARRLSLRLPAVREEREGPLANQAPACVPQGLEHLRSLVSLELQLDWKEQRHQAPGHQLLIISSLTNLRHLRLEACLASPLPPETLSCLRQLTSLAIEVPLSWGGEGLLRLCGRHLAACTALRQLTLGRVALALSAAEALLAWRQLEALCLLDAELAHNTAGGGGVLAALPALRRLRGVTVLWGGSSCCTGSVRSSLAGCTALEELDLRVYRLRALPTLHAALTSLSLHFSAAMEPPPAAALRSLLRLSLSFTRHIEPWLLQLARQQPPRLRCLRVHCCCLEELPGPCTGLTSLQELLLSENRLRALPPGPYLERLQHLELRANRLEEVPACLAAASYLNCLDLSQNTRLAAVGLGCEVLAGLAPRLRELNLTGCPGMGSWQEHLSV